MAKHTSKYRQLERLLSTLLLIHLGIFVLFLILSGFGLVALKIIFAIISILASVLGLFILHTTKEMFRARSLWMTCAFGSMLLLTIVSLICNYPA